MSHSTTNKLSVCKAKTDQTIHPDWVSPSLTKASLGAHRVTKDRGFLHGDIEASDHTKMMPSLVYVFSRSTATLFFL